MKGFEDMGYVEVPKIIGKGKSSRDYTYVNHFIQMNFLAGPTTNPVALGKAFNVALGGRNTLNEFYKLISNSLAEQFRIQNSKFLKVLFTETSGQAISVTPMPTSPKRNAMSVTSRRMTSIGG